MKRLLLDTNIYGEMIFDADFMLLKEKLQKECIVHSFRVVRDEIRDISKSTKIQGKNMRIALLHVYDEITKKEYLATEEMDELSKKYYEIYRKLGSIHPYKKMKNDFLVVACATIHQIDLVVSEDCKTMLVENALRAYDTINKKMGLRTPIFNGYLDLKRLLLE